LVESGLNTRKELRIFASQSRKAQLIDYHNDIAPTVESIPGLEIVTWLHNLNALKVNINENSIDSIKKDQGNCSGTKARVYYAWIAEDSERDDADGYPGSEIQGL